MEEHLENLRQEHEEEQDDLQLNGCDTNLFWNV